MSILDELVARYRARVPDFAAIEGHLLADGAIVRREQIGNDHIAFRTLGLPHLGIASIEPLFLHHGYVRKDAYHFASKHLDALWYQPPTDSLPRAFISELRVDALAPPAARLLRASTAAVARGPLSGIDLDDPRAIADALETLPWPVPRLTDYQTLLPLSEYAAWTLVNGYRLNHVTLSVHGLRADLQSIAALNDYLEARGFCLNAAGGKIKLSPDGLLVQSSTLAQPIHAAFSGGEHLLAPGPYIEFAERRVLPEFAHLAASDVQQRHRRDGFEAANADRIFESTNITIDPRDVRS